jgi:hypothetical protein
MKANKPIRRQAVSNHGRRKDKESESSIDSAAHNKTLKQKQLNGRNHHIPLNVNRLNSLIKRHHLAKWIKKEIQQSVVYRRPMSLTETTLA